MNAESPFPVVGIGAYAGGIDALEDFFKAVPANPGMAFVLITPLAADRESWLPDILARHTDLPVHVASDGQKIEANRVYVLPPNANLTIAERRLRLHETTAGPHERMPIDAFFSSLAQDCGDRAVGIVLSDGGHDGVLGVRAIKEQGGLTLAQSGGSSGLGFAGTPESAIAGSLFDFVVPVDAMAAKLIENTAGRQKVEVLAEARDAGEDDDANPDAREAIHGILRARTGDDFSRCKARAFLRRVQRRMRIRHCNAFAHCAPLLPRRPDGHPPRPVAFGEQQGACGSTTVSVSAAADPDVASYATRAELEWRDTRERQQGRIEEYETALEELKSANDELLAVNRELYARIEELDRANGDLASIFASIDIATLFVDRHRCVRSATPAAEQLFGVMPADQGRPLADLPLADLAIRLDYPELHADIAKVLESGEPLERRVRWKAAEAPCFLARLAPCRAADGAIEGVAASFVDVTSLARSEARQRALVSELNHRVKNTLAVIMSIAQQTLASAASPDEFQKSFFGRLRALARSYELLSHGNWGEVAVESVLRQALAPFFPPNRERIALSGPEILLMAELALSFGVIIDELATNAVKYGALSTNDEGSVAIDWSIAGATGDGPPRLTLNWRESGGPKVETPERMGFGLKVIKGEIEYSHSGVATFDFAETGFSARFEIPLSRERENPQGASDVNGAPGVGP